MRHVLEPKNGTEASGGEALTLVERRRLWSLFLVVTVVTGWAALSARFPACRFAEVFGLPCVGCGGTRAARALVDGNVVEAWRHNPIVVLLAISVPLAATADALERPPAFLRALRRSAEWSVLAGTVLLFLVRLAKVRGAM